MTILVTGASGFVGAGVTLHLAAAHPDEMVLATDAVQPAGPVAAAYFRCRNIGVDRLDVTDREQVRAALAGLRPRAVVHAAALTLAEPEARLRVVDVNLGGTLNVLAAAEAAGVARTVIASSSGVYAAGPGEFRREEDPVDPGSAYAASKLAAEALAAAWGAVAARIGSVYGPFEVPRPSRPRVSAVGTMAAALDAGRPVALAGGEVARDWTHVEDIAAGIDALLSAPRLRYAVYNLGNGRAEPLSAVADAFARHGLAVRWTDASRADIAFGPADRRPALAIDRLVADTGFAPRHTIESGIAALAAAALI